MSVSLCPIWNEPQFLDNDGKLLSGGLIYQYAAGTSDLLPTYVDYTETGQNTNPIVLDSSGRLPADIWLTSGVAYKLVLKTADDLTILKTVDNIFTPVIIAGNNITIDPTSGVGSVIINAIDNSGGSTGATGQSYVFEMTNSSNNYFYMDGSQWDSWDSVICKVPVVLPGTPDVVWNPNGLVFNFNIAGSYRIELTASFDPTMSIVDGYWPPDMSFFGFVLAPTSDAEFMPSSMHTRYSAFPGDNLSPSEQVTTWTDIFTLAMQANDTLDLLFVADCPTNTGAYGIAKVTAIITRIGDPYDPTIWPGA